MDNFLHWHYANPVLLSLGFFTIHWYGALFAIGLILAHRMLAWIYQKEARNPMEIDSLALYAVGFGVIGARLVHCFFYEPERFLANPMEIPLIWKGGLASHGGLIGFLLGVYLYTKGKERAGFVWLLDHLSIPLCILSACIRIANFVNSEIIGTPTNQPWAVVFSQVDNIPRHPVQIYEAIAYIVLFGVLMFIYRKYQTTNTKPPKGLLFGTFISLISLARFGLEFFKSSQAHNDASSIINMGQWLTIPTFLLGLMFLYIAKRQPKTN